MNRHAKERKMKAIQIKQYGGEEQRLHSTPSTPSHIGQYAPGLPLEVSFHPGR
jgi:hypothetical protein